MSKPKTPSREDVKIAIGLIKCAIQDCDKTIRKFPSLREHYSARRSGLDSAYFFLTGKRIPEPVEAEGA